MKITKSYLRKIIKEELITIAAAVVGAKI